MDALPTFRLFVDPVGEEVFERTAATCEICGDARGWRYVAGTFGENEQPECLCPWCIADGSAAAHGYYFNVTDAFSCSKDTPGMSAEDVVEVQERTPGFVTWQDYGWMMCCGRACQYVGEADAADLRGKWAGAVESIVSNTYEIGWSDTDREELIRSIAKGRGPCAYVFECVECGRLLGFWDHH